MRTLSARNCSALLRYSSHRRFGKREKMRKDDNIVKLANIIVNDSYEKAEQRVPFLVRLRRLCRMKRPTISSWTLPRRFWLKYNQAGCPVTFPFAFLL